MSISKAQASALAEGFFDNLGSSKDVLNTKETFSEVIIISIELVELMQKNLITANAIASGLLSESIEVGEPYMEAGVIQVDIYMNFYGRFINSGVRGTKGGTGLYQFKFDEPGKKMIAAIDAWLQQGKLKVRSVKKYKGYGRNERKNKTLAKLDSAYAVAKSIKMKGIKPRGFLDKALLSIERQFSKRLGTSIKVDIINALNAGN